MSERKKISVALAAYKGEKFIREQLESVLSQLAENDEIIVSDDMPGGETEKIVLGMARTDGRIKLVQGSGEGVIKNFENALHHCTGEYIFLCDQDDVWLPDKVEAVVAELEGGADLVLHNAMVTDENLKVTDTSYFASHASKKGFVTNLIRNSYMGCCMAFKKSIAEKALPFPENLPMHDQWIGLTAEKYGKTKLIEKPLILYRRHSNAVTGKKASAAQKLRWRRDIVCAVMRKK